MALAMGTPKVKSVNKIVGPGSSWVALAKKLVFLEGLCGIESMNAGPSEIICWADSSTSPDIVASSMLAQSEHDPESMAILLTKDKNLIKKVELSIANQIKDLPRKEIAKKSLKANGALIYASSDKKIVSIINYIAPEHIEILNKNYKKVVEIHSEANMLGKDVSHDHLAQAIRAISTPILNKPIGQISLAKLLGQILGLSKEFNIEVQPQFTLLQKTMLMAEGTTRQINPNINMWELSGPLIDKWISESHDPFKTLEDWVHKNKILLLKIQIKVWCWRGMGTKQWS